MVSVTGITTLCLRCINPATMTTDTMTIWELSDQTLTNGQNSIDGLIRIVGGIAEITNPQTRIIDGSREYEVECIGPENSYNYDRIDIYTDSKYNTLCHALCLY